MKTRFVGVCLLVFFFVPPLWADDSPRPAAKTHEVPYRLTPMQNVLVRAKINGKGPFNFMVDTGAPALFVSTGVCRKLGIEPDKKGWGTFDRFELEGGLVINKARGRIEDPFQLEGMNGLGLAGAELHGIIGYNILARFRLELDFTKDKLGLTPLKFEPAEAQGLGGTAVPGELDALAGIMKTYGKLTGARLNQEVTLRAFLGIELAEAHGTVTVKSVLGRSPAADAGLKAGDRITRFQGKEVQTTADMNKLAEKLAAGQEARLTVQRGSETVEITVKTGEGL